MNTDTTAVILIGFMLGIICTLAFICAVQFMNDEYAFPTKEIRSTFDL